MALTKITSAIIADGAITASAITNTSITADKLHTTLDLTGKAVTVATATAGDNDTTAASTAFVSTAIANLADSAPSTLNTLNELAAALGDDANFSTTVTNSIATKLPLAGGTMTGNLTVNAIVDADNFKVNGAQGTDGQVLTSTGSGIAWEDAAGTTINNNADNRIITGSGTANTLEGESGLLFDGTNLLLGTTSHSTGAFGAATGINVKKPRPQVLLQDTTNNTDAYFGLTDSGVFLATQDALAISFHTSDVERMRIDSNGNAAIGTSSTDIESLGSNYKQLTIASSTSLYPGMVTYQTPSTTNTSAEVARIHYLNGTNRVGQFLVKPDGAANNSAYMAWFTMNAGTLSERMRISSAGNVGIGTTSPGNLLEVSHDANAHTAVLRITGTSSSAYAGGLEFYTGYGGGKVIPNTFATASGGNGGEYWQELRNQSSNTLKRIYHVSNAAMHTFHGQHNGDSTGHFLFTNSLYDTASTNCSLVVQNGYTFIQIMGWTSNGARIGTRTGGWSGNSGGDVYFTRQDATSIKLASSGPQLGNGTAISSDRRLKENITNLADGQLAKINALTPRTFTWKDTRKPGTHEGFIAQEVEAVIPEAVFEDNFAPDPDDDSRDFEGDIKLIKHEVINARLIKAVQEQQTIIDDLKSRIETLEG